MRTTRRAPDSAAAVAAEKPALPPPITKTSMFGDDVSLDIIAVVEV